MKLHHRGRLYQISQKMRIVFLDKLYDYRAAEEIIIPGSFCSAKSALYCEIIRLAPSAASAASANPSFFIASLIPLIPVTPKRARYAG